MSKATKTKPVKEESFVKPSIQVNDSKENVISNLIEGSNAPEIQSIGVFKVPGTNHYVSFTMITKGKEVISIEVEEPNLRAIAEESAKISFVEKFMSGDIHE